MSKSDFIKCSVNEVSDLLDIFYKMKPTRFFHKERLKLIKRGDIIDNVIRDGIDKQLAHGTVGRTAMNDLRQVVSLMTFALHQNTREYFDDYKRKINEILKAVHNALSGEEHQKEMLIFTQDGGETKDEFGTEMLKVESNPHLINTNGRKVVKAVQWLFQEIVKAGHIEDVHHAIPELSSHEELTKQLRAVMILGVFEINIDHELEIDRLRRCATTVIPGELLKRMIVDRMISVYHWSSDEITVANVIWIKYFMTVTNYRNTQFDWVYGEVLEADIHTELKELAGKDFIYWHDAIHETLAGIRYAFQNH